MVESAVAVATFSSELATLRLSILFMVLNSASAVLASVMAVVIS